MHWNVRRLLLPVAVCAITSSALTSRAQHPAVRLLKAQEYYGRPSLAPAGGSWFGLYKADGGWVLSATRVSIDTSKPTSTVVAVDRPERPLFLFQGQPTFAEGSVDVAFVGAGFVYPGQPHDLTLAGELYVLRAAGTKRGRQGDITFANYRLELEHAGRTQVLFRASLVEEEGPNLVLAGDLDRDGRLDLVFDLRHSYVGNHYVLFLSSLAPQDSLVIKAAELLVMGS